MNSQYLITLSFVLLTLVLPLSSATNSFESYDTKKFPALYVFGDSLIDCGNNNHLPSGGADYLPYGIDFMGGNKPTGRATNGKTVADFLGKINYYYFAICVLTFYQSINYIWFHKLMFIINFHTFYLYNY